MKIKILGAHNTESRNTKHTCLLVDNTLLLDAGSITSSLSFRDQVKIKAVLLTHAHYDHIRDVPGFAMNLFLRKRSALICTHQPVKDSLLRYFLNNDTYPDFTRRPPDDPVLRVRVLEPFQETEVEGYRVLGIPVRHALPAMGYQVKSADGKTIFYTGDTGVNLSDAWKLVSPQVLFIELTGPNRWAKAMNQSGHLTPDTLKQELLGFRQIKGYLPEVVVVHLNPADENLIASETATLEDALGIPVQLGYEGMQIQL